MNQVCRLLINFLDSLINNSHLGGEFCVWTVLFVLS